MWRSQIQRQAERWGAENLLIPLKGAVLASPQKLLRRSSSLRISASSQLEEVILHIKAGQTLLTERETEIAMYGTPSLSMSSFCLPLPLLHFISSFCLSLSLLQLISSSS
jgi:hypothetical protein